MEGTPGRIPEASERILKGTSGGILEDNPIGISEVISEGIPEEIAGGILGNPGRNTCNELLEESQNELMPTRIPKETCERI